MARSLVVSGFVALRAGVRALKSSFVERQIYVRCDGRVQFYTIGPAPQVAVALLIISFLTWAAFISVVDIFRDQIVVANEHRFERKQALYEAKIGDLQISYDNLVAHAADIQVYADRQTSSFIAKQQRFAREAGPVSDSPLKISTLGTNDAEPVLGHIVQNAMEWLGISAKTLVPKIHYPSLDRLAADTAVLKTDDHQSTALMGSIEAGTLARVASEKALIASTGLNVDLLLHYVESVEGEGGPEISLNTVQLQGINDQAFSDSYFRAEANLGEIRSLQAVEKRLPTAKPSHVALDRTSGFGARVDPFTGRFSFHPGVDFAGPLGSPVIATGNGRISFVGREGGYGNVVEIDHGYGFKTRYGHLTSATVTLGQQVTTGMVVGRLGSTGRSTGPHVHYEVWFAKVVRNPDGFLRLGHLSDRPTAQKLAKTP